MERSIAQPDDDPRGCNVRSGTIGWHALMRLLAGGLVALSVPCAGASRSNALRFDASSAACGQTGALPPACGNIVFDGDSISAGAGSFGGQGLDSQFMRELQVAARLANVAVGGRPVSECLRLYDANVVPLFVRSARFNLIVFHAGDNDISQGHNAAQTYDVFTQYVAAAHAQGWKVIVSTELQRPNFPPEKQAMLNDYNRRLLANEAGADVVVDLSSDPRMTDPAARHDPALFTSDGVHPSNGGYTILAHILAAAARPLLPR